MRKILSLFLGIFFFASNCVLVHAFETNFWRERQRNQSRQNQNPTQLASLPALPQPASGNFISQFPSLKVRPPKISDRKNFQRKGLPKISAPLRDLVDTIPLNHARIQEIHDLKTPLHPPIVLIQDIHLNTEAQGHIASILQEFINKIIYALLLSKSFRGF